MPSSAVEFTAIQHLNIPSSDSSRSILSTTVILFFVSVPVLSVQITVAAPIVSQACNLRTRLFSLSIRRILSAKLTVILIGKPSGTATTISVTAIMIVASANSAISTKVYSESGLGSKNISEMMRPTMISEAIIKLAVDIHLPSCASCALSGVSTSLPSLARATPRPSSVSTPTAETRIAARPSIMVEPRNKKFDG